MEGGEGEVGGGTETAMDDLVADRGTPISELFKRVNALQKQLRVIRPRRGRQACNKVATDAC